MIYLIRNATGKPHFLGTMSGEISNMEVEEGERHCDRPVMRMEIVDYDDSKFQEILDSYILQGYNLYNVYGVDSCTKMSYEEIKVKYDLPSKTIKDNLNSWKTYDYYKIRNKNIMKATKKYREKKKNEK